MRVGAQHPHRVLHGAARHPSSQPAAVPRAQLGAEVVHLERPVGGLLRRVRRPEALVGGPVEVARQGLGAAMGRKVIQTPLAWYISTAIIHINMVFTKRVRSE